VSRIKELRDQLALNYCSWKLDIPIFDLDLSNVRDGGEYFSRFKK
tara:strand:+ start:165 stop:299 length:135 start_codon:yes stop_codon:yes gene_type:complete